MNNLPTTSDGWIDYALGNDWNKGGYLRERLNYAMQMYAKHEIEEANKAKEYKFENGQPFRRKYE